MKQKLSFYLLIATIFFFFTFSLALARSTSESYIIFGDVFSAGGTSTSTSNTYSLHDTIGEAAILSATSTSASYGIKAGFQELYADQFITLTLESSTSATVSFGTLSAAAANVGSHTMQVSSNAANGIVVTVSGATLTSGANTITAIGSSAAASSVGTEQFGINLVDNTSPNVGATASGTAPILAVANQYNLADNFAFTSGATIATSTAAINTTNLVVSYLVNIASNTEAGTYSTTLTYSATANF